MSAFVVSHNHINTLLSWANRHRMGGINLPDGTNLNFNQVDDLQTMAEILLAENVRSVDERYNETKVAEAITFQFVGTGTQPINIIKACQCYDYQACETDDYQETAVYRIIDWIRSKAIHSLPGYDEADWEIN